MQNELKTKCQIPKEGFVPDSCEVRNSTIGLYTEIGKDNYIENSHIGDYSYTSPYCFLQNTVVGKFSNIAAMVRIGPTAHPMNRATLHHFTYRRVKYGFAPRDDEQFFEWRAQQVTLIGHDTWIGHGAIIMPGVTIGNGAVIGAGAVVTKDVDRYSVTAGCPAKQIKLRFTEEQISQIEKIAWWDWTHAQIAERVADFSLPVNEFIRKYRGLE